MREFIINPLNFAVVSYNPLTSTERKLLNKLYTYHNMTGSKYAMTGRVYRPEFDETVKPQLHLNIFQSYGIEVTVL